MSVLVNVCVCLMVEQLCSLLKVHLLGPPREKETPACVSRFKRRWGNTSVNHSSCL